MRYGLKIVASFSTTTARKTMQSAFAPGTVASLLQSLDTTDDAAKPMWVWRGLYATQALRDTARTSALAVWTAALAGSRIVAYTCYDDETPRRLSVKTDERVK